MVGQTLGHYKILEKLGAGGMGEVYRAEDTTLDREVALKLLTSDLSESQERLDRFQREAKTLAGLDHPNIVTVFTVEHDEDVHFLTMQLVEGKQLSKLIPEGGMSLERIFDIAIPLASALAVAHEKGVMHRDLKPANIMLSDDGRVKVLDFGLAKLQPDLDATVATEIPTEPLTGEGRILGTIPYMSPEQLEGRPVDRRTDVFSLGVVLYEIATGERPFKGDTSLSVMSSIVNDEPRTVDDVNEDLPHHLGRIIRRCLEKDRDRRFQSAKEIRNELEDLQAEAESGELWERKLPAPQRRRRKAWVWTLSGVAAVTLGLTGYLTYRRTLADPEEFPAAPPALARTLSQLTFEQGTEMDPSFTPDGRSFVYGSYPSGNGDIYLRRVTGGKVINLTEGSLEDDLHPALSPDGEQIAFRSDRDGGGIFVMGAMGEDVRQLTDFGYFPAWSPDGEKIVFTTGWMRTGWTQARNQRIWTVAVASGEIKEVLDHSALQPDWSPNGQRIAFWGKSPGVDGRYDIFTVPAIGGQPVAVTQDPHYDDEPVWSADGQYLYFCSRRGGTENIWRVPIDEATGEVLGEPEPVTSGTLGAGGLSIAQNGDRLAFFVQNRGLQIQSVSFDPEAERVIGDPTAVTPQGLDAIYPSVSPDGEWVAFAGRFAGPRSWSIGITRIDGTGLRQLTESGQVDTYPSWSPDGERIAFWSRRSGSREVWLVQRDGSGLQQLTEVPGKTVQPPLWSPDGRHLATAINYGATYVFDADNPWTEEPPKELPRFQASGNVFFLPWSWSPDGGYLAGNAHGENENGSEAGGIVLYSFDTGEYRQITDYGQYPLWFADGLRILFLAGVEGEPPARFSVLDTETGEAHEVLSGEILGITPDAINFWPRLSPNNRAIFFTRFHDEADIWMLSLGEQG